jgi:hypothetical protein
VLQLRQYQVLVLSTAILPFDAAYCCSSGGSFVRAMGKLTIGMIQCVGMAVAGKMLVGGRARKMLGCEGNLEHKEWVSHISWNWKGENKKCLGVNRRALGTSLRTLYYCFLTFATLKLKLLLNVKQDLLQIEKNGYVGRV